MITLTNLAASAALPPPVSSSQAQPASSLQDAANANNPNNQQGEAAPPPSPFAFLLAQRSATGALRPTHTVTAKAEIEKDSKTEQNDAATGAAQAGASPLFWLALPLNPEAARTLTPPATTVAVASGGRTLVAAGAAAADIKPGAAAGAKPAAPVHGLPAAEPDLRAELQAFVLPPQNQGHQANTNDTPASTAALAAAANQAPAAPPPVAAPVVTIESKIGTPRWTRDIQENISLLVQSNTSVASLKLTPADMGPIEIRIDFSEKQPSVSISVQQADTRNALDAALPRLREMLAESGVNLGDTSVAQQNSQGGDSSGRERAPGDLRGQRTEAVAIPPTPAARLLAIDQLVDTYA